MDEKRNVPEEGLHLDTADTSLGRITEDEAFDVDNAFTVGPQFDFAIGLASVIKLHTRGNVVARSWGERECTPPDGVSIVGIAIRLGLDGAQDLVGLVSLVGVRRDVGVDFSLATGTSH
jgi:hypothetical protein